MVEEEGDDDDEGAEEGAGEAGEGMALEVGAGTGVLGVRGMDGGNGNDKWNEVRD